MRYLGIDFGLKKIGLAVSEGELAAPLKIIEVRSLVDAVDKIVREMGEIGADKIIIGMPEGKTGEAVKKLVNVLKKKGLEVEFADETLSTKHAQKVMIEMGVSKKKRQVNDAQVAAIILQGYLDSR